MKKKLYIGFSIYQLLLSIAARLSLIFAFIYLYIHYDENPTLITIISLFGVFLFFIIGVEMILVYEDRMVISIHSLAALLFRRKDKIYFFRDIQKAYLPQVRPATTASEFAVAVALMFIYARGRRIPKKSKFIFLQMVTGEEVKIVTQLNDNQVTQIVALINQYTHRKVDHD